MGLAKTITAALLGIKAPRVEVEVHMNRGLPAFDIVGLPQDTVKEGRKRIRAAILSSGFEFPLQKITVNLAPADLKKGGSRFDLPIAVGILAAAGQIPIDALSQQMFIGELALDGSLRPTGGGLAALQLCQQQTLSCLHLPAASTLGFDLLPDQAYRTYDNLAAVVQQLNQVMVSKTQQYRPQPVLKDKAQRHRPPVEVDLADVMGHTVAKRALMIAAAGFHSMMLSGPAGVGKSMLARALRGILPDPNVTEMLEIALLNSSQASVPATASWFRPYRAPHHTLSVAGFLIKQGMQPGEVALAHRGVLFMDEFPEFRRDVIEALREPLEQGHYHISRSWGELDFPSRFMLVAAMNPCPCGFYGDPQAVCQCSLSQVQRYQRKASQPILDRIDLHLRLERGKLSATSQHNSAVVQQQVEAAAQIQQQRYRGLAYRFNADIPVESLPRYCALTDADQAFLHGAVEALQLSFRATHRLLKVARTIADLAEVEQIGRGHLLEALQYRAIPVVSGLGERSFCDTKRA